MKAVLFVLAAIAALALVAPGQAGPVSAVAARSSAVAVRRPGFDLGCYLGIARDVAVFITRIPALCWDLALRSPNFAYVLPMCFVHSMAAAYWLATNVLPPNCK